MKYSYTVNDNNVLTIFTENNMSIADISDCENMTDEELQNLITEVLSEMGYE